MKYCISALLFLLVSVTASAADRSVVWSPYSGNIKLVAFNEADSSAHFRGHETLRGRLFFQFDMVDEQRVDGVLFAKLVPDQDTLLKLPYVMSGFYPSAINHISLRHPERALEMTVGVEEAKLLSHGSNSEVSFDVEVDIEFFGSSVECDARLYFADALSIRRPGIQLAGINDSHRYGC